MSACRACCCWPTKTVAWHAQPPTPCVAYFQIFHHLVEAGTNSTGNAEGLLNTPLPSDAAVPAGAAAATPLIVALRCKNFDAAALLVEEGASLSTTYRDADGMTALHLAAQTAPESLLAHITECVLQVLCPCRFSVSRACVCVSRNNPAGAHIVLMRS